MLEESSVVDDYDDWFLRVVFWVYECNLEENL